MITVETTVVGSSYCPTSSLVRLNSLFCIKGGWVRLHGTFSSMAVTSYINIHFKVPSLNLLCTWRLVTAWKTLHWWKQWPVTKTSYQYGCCNRTDWAPYFVTDWTLPSFPDWTRVNQKQKFFTVWPHFGCLRPSKSQSKANIVRNI